MTTKLLIGLTLAGGVALAAPASAQTLPVTVTHDNGGVQVGVGTSTQPIAGVSYDDRGVCAGASLQTTHCVPVTIVGP